MCHYDEAIFARDGYLAGDDVRRRLLDIWAVMVACVQRGCEREGILPGGLKVRRRAAAIHRRLRTAAGGVGDPLTVIDWVNLFAPMPPPIGIRMTTGTVS